MPLSIFSGLTNDFQTEKHNQNQAFSPQTSSQTSSSESLITNPKKRRAVIFIE